MQDAIEIRLRGDGILPGLVRSHEIAEILGAIEDFVVAETLRADPSARKDEIIVGLYEIADKSIGLRFKTSISAIAIPAFVIASQALASGNFGALSSQSLKPLEVLASFSRRHNAVAEFKLAESAKSLAEITPTTTIPRPAIVTGQTEIPARVLRVGGKSPKAMLELQDGSVIYCEIPVDRAIELGHRLYETVLFSGMATWNASTLDVEEFSITAFKEFPKENVVDVMDKLRRLVGAQLSSIRNVDEFVTNLRREGGAE